MFEPVALWRRAWYFPKAGEDMHAAVSRECRAVRASVGIFDASTLGKIEVVGPDAVTFLERMYTNPWAKLGVGRCRYGLLLGEDGFIRDDGVIGASPRTVSMSPPRRVARRASQHDGGLPSDRVARPAGLADLHHRAVGGRRAAGPQCAPAARTLRRGAGHFPRRLPAHGGRRVQGRGLPARLFRVSFTGELGFEVNVPARHGRALWEKLWEAGQQCDVCPTAPRRCTCCGPKGYIIVGQDTDGTLTPDDANLNWAVGRAKTDFVGKRSLIRPDMVAKGRNSSSAC